MESLIWDLKVTRNKGGKVLRGGARNRADNAIASEHITDLHVVEAKLAAGSVTPGVFEG